MRLSTLIFTTAVLLLATNVCSKKTHALPAQYRATEPASTGKSTIVPPTGPCLLGWSLYDDASGTEGRRSCFKEVQYDSGSARKVSYSEANEVCKSLRSSAHLMTISSNVGMASPGLLKTFLDAASFGIGYLGCRQLPSFVAGPGRTGLSWDWIPDGASPNKANLFCADPSSGNCGGTTSFWAENEPQ